MSIYCYQPLEAETEIRLVTILPGYFDDPITIQIGHAQLLPLGEETQPKRPSLREIRKTLDKNWDVHYTLEGRVFFNNRTTKNSSWAHPDSGYREYDFSRYEEPKTSPLGYEALSYVWGDPEISGDFLVRNHGPASGGPHPPGPPSQATRLPARRNLTEAMRYLRYPDQPRTLWIDAICINQEDMNERSRQVQKMGDIYRLARRVVAWLGTAPRGCELAFPALSYLGQQVEETRTKESYRSVDCKEPAWHSSAFLLPYDEALWKAVYKIYTRPWFKRTWILQEIQLASPASIIKCGKFEAPWPLFRRAVLNISYKERGVPQCILDEAQVSRTCLNFMTRFPTMIRYNYSRECADHRDKIYGMKCLMPGSMASLIPVDYSHSILDVYKSAFLAYTQSSHRLELLEYSGKWPAMPIGVPTWVPNWSTWRPYDDQRLVFRASGISPARYTFEPTTQLKVDALYFKSITEIVQDRFEIFEEAEEYIRRQGIQKLQEAEYASGGDLLDAYLRTFTFESLKERTSVSHTPTLSDLKNLVTATTGGDQGRLPTAKWMARTTDRLASSVFFHAENYLGSFNNIHEALPGMLEPPSHGKVWRLADRLALGDQIFIVLGCDVPLVLRPTSNGEYEVVGRCYLCGIMDGEAVLGPLDTYHVTSRAGDDDFYVKLPHYKNRDSPEEQLRSSDPRLEQIQLPSEWECISWERTRDDPRSCSKFRHRDTGEIIDYDPRMTAEALRGRGVPIRQITLI